MALAAEHAVGGSASFEDSLRVINEMARAKAEIDIAAWHDLSIAKITSDILDALQRFLEDQTVPCTEWPSPNELSIKAMHVACKHALA